MSLTTITTDHAPAAIGPYSQAVSTGSLLFTSGQLPIDPRLGKIPDGSIEDHTHLALRNLEAIAKEAGTSLAKAIKVTIFLQNINDFQAVNSIYSEYFKEPFPARSAFQVAALPLDAAIEIEAVFSL